MVAVIRLQPIVFELIPVDEIPRCKWGRKKKQPTPDHLPVFKVEVNVDVLFVFLIDGKETTAMQFLAAQGLIVLPSMEPQNESLFG